MSETGRELLEKAIWFDFEFATISNMSHKEYVSEKRHLQNDRKFSFHKAVNALSAEARAGNQKAQVSLAAAIRYFDDLAESCPVLEGTVAPKAAGGDSLQIFGAAVEKEVVIRLVEKAEKLYQKAISKEPIPYQFRNQWLERAIKIILDLSDISNEQRWKFDEVKPAITIYQFLADAYLSRGLSILPKGKGMSTPEKKLEAMRKAMFWSQKALEADGTDLDANLTKVQSLYELYQMDKKAYESPLKTALSNLKEIESFFPPKTPFQCFCLSLYCRFYDDVGSQEQIFDFQIKPHDKKKYPYLPLIQAQAGAALLESRKIRWTDFQPKFNAAINQIAKVGLFSPVWEDTVVFMKEMEARNVAGWQKAAWNAWKFCHNKERQMGFGLQIRQYWSRLSDIYALAYKGAISDQSVEKAVQVVDSLKGRTTLTWEEMDAFLAAQTGKLADEMTSWRKKYFMGEAQSAMGCYVSGYRDLVREKLPKAFKPTKAPLPVSSIPSKWAAVHLYLDQNDKKEFRISALIGENAVSGGNGSSWRFEKSVDANPLWDSYRRWLGVYKTLEVNGDEGLDACADVMDDLCCTMGQTLPFLFEMAERVEGIIFVPHGFTHQLPLHAAKGAKNEYLFEKVFNTYLPAWSLGPDRRKKNPKTPTGRYCLRYHTEKKNIDVYADLIDSPTDPNRWTWKRNSHQINKETMSDLKKEIDSNPPEWLSILCHGKADALYPFQSSLSLGHEGICFLDLQLTPLNLTGSKVVLGACETELTPVGNSQLDEHLSLAGIFLGKGAELVMGSLWACEGGLVRELTESALDSDAPFWEVLGDKQRSWLNAEDEGFPEYWDEFKIRDRKTRLLYVAPFRILGHPGFLQGSNDKPK